MKIDALTRLFSTNTPASRVNPNNNKETQAVATQTSRAQAADSYSGLQGNDAAQSARRERVAELKQAVSNGTYKPKSQDVAAALARELFA